MNHDERIKNMAASPWVEIIGGMGLMTLLSIILGTQNKKIDKKMDKEVCVQRCTNTDHIFGSIETQQQKCQQRFSEFDKKIDKQSQTLTRIETILDIAAQKNGWK